MRSSVKAKGHFGANFNQKLEFYIELPTDFMDFNETLHMQSFPEGPPTCVLIFRSAGQRSKVNVT